MANKNSTSNLAEQGFTLLETLVALGVATILLSTLIPIARNTLFRIVTIDEESRILSILEKSLLSKDDVIRSGTENRNGTILKIKNRDLPPFNYEKGVADQWQPHLVTIEAQVRSGATLRIETIRLERTLP